MKETRMDIMNSTIINNNKGESESDGYRQLHEKDQEKKKYRNGKTGT